MKYIFDFDNTIVYTDEINSLAYNEALKITGYKSLNFDGRITRKIIVEQYPDISEHELQRIINIKKAIFVENIHHIKLNNRLVNIIKTIGVENCILWTRAESERVNFILEKYNLTHLFCSIKYSNKKDIQNDIGWFVDFLKCNKDDLCFIEDDEVVIKNVAAYSINIVNVRNIKSITDLPT